MKHEITRVRHDTVRRSLTIRNTEYITPNMLRLTLGGEALKGFTSLGADDHIKIFVPGTGGETERRDYTPRHYNEAAQELTIDFAIHDAGPATAWARAAKPGDSAEIGGPRGSMVVPHDFDWYLLIGDETALPAIGRRVEELPAGAKVTTLVTVTGPEEEQSFAAKADHQPLWVHRPASQADDPAPLLAAMNKLPLPAGDGFVWIAAEAKVARAARALIQDEKQHPAQWVKASGYWVKGEADSSEKMEARG